MNKTLTKLTRGIAQNIFFALCLIVLFLVLSSFSQEFMRAKKINQEIVTLRDEISGLEEKNTELAELIQYFDSDTYAERKARQEMGLKKPDEEVIVIPESALELTDEQSEDELVAVSNPLRWWRYFVSQSTQSEVRPE